MSMRELQRRIDDLRVGYLSESERDEKLRELGEWMDLEGFEWVRGSSSQARCPICNGPADWGKIDTIRDRSGQIWVERGLWCDAPTCSPSTGRHVAFADFPVANPRLTPRMEAPGKDEGECEVASFDWTSGSWK